MNNILEKILKQKEVETPQGKKIHLHSSIDVAEGSMLMNLIKNDSSIVKTLEVGCAYGVSSLFIAEGLMGRSNAHHIIIDPFQHSQWENIGIHNLQKSGFSDYTLIEKKSEIALPMLLSSKEEFIDLIFIDGFHTFDHTLVDCFYALRLLRVGGYLIVDDVALPSVRKVIDYILLYPSINLVSEITLTKQTIVSFKKRLAQFMIAMMPKDLQKKILSKSFRRRLMNEYQSMVILKKIANDDRNWDWFQEDF